MPKSNQPSAARLSASEKERYERLSRDMFRDSGGPKVSTIARKLNGRIIRWNDHFGFISSDDGKDDVYVHESELSETLTNAEEKVGFLVQFDLVARETFDRVASVDAGSKRQKSARSVQLLAEPHLIGRLTWKGTFGFIKCADETEYFCTERDFLKAGLSLETGAVVQFIGVSGSTGKRLRAMRISPSTCALPVELVAEPQMNARQSAPTNTIQTALDGRIVKLDQEKKFGFIRPKEEGNDIYFKITEQMGRLHMQAQVLFSLQQDSKGNLSAFDVIQTALDGRIVKLDQEKKFGFIRPEEEGNDIYFKITEQMGRLYMQAQVLFSLQQDSKGNLIAFDVVVVGRPASDLRPVTRAEPVARVARWQNSGPEWTGLVTSWNDEKGYGFITPDHEDGAVFAHSGDVGVLKRGTRVTFVVVDTLKGKKAVEVRSSRHTRTICRNPACRGAHFTDNCPLNRRGKKLMDSDDAASEATCSTTATMVPCPSTRLR